MKWLINIIVIISFGYLLFWNSQDINSTKSSIKEILVDETSYPNILLRWQQSLILSNYSNLKIYENPQEIMIEILVIKNQISYKYIYIEDKSEVFYKKDNLNLFAFEVIVMEGDSVVFQFTGERNFNKPLGNQYEEIDIIAYMSGLWEKELIPVASAR